MAATHAGDIPSSGAGWGDTFINYRYQLLGTGETRVAVAPRVSLLLPTGSQVEGRGIGGPGIQTNFPLSLVVNRYIVTHWNAGVTWVPQAQNERQQKAKRLARTSANLSCGSSSPDSMPWLKPCGPLTPKWLVLAKPNQRHDLYVSPGIRWAYNFKSGLQIVPGDWVPYRGRSQYRR